MIEPKWVDLEKVVAFHREEIEYSGGLYGMRDVTLLESAFLPTKSYQKMNLRHGLKPIPARYRCNSEATKNADQLL